MDNLIYKAFYDIDIYDGIENFCALNNIPTVLELGSSAHDTPFDILIGTNKPKLIIEIGSYLGASAILMANTLKKHGVEDFTIICIDTWLGSAEHYTIHKQFSPFQKYAKHGYSTMYYQFLNNVKLAGLQNNIIPLPLPSNAAAEVLRHIFNNKLFADLVYVDGAHDTQSVHQDSFNYYNLLKVGGILCGDDMIWPSVAAGVINALNDLNVPIGRLQVFEPNKVFWFLKK